MSALIDFDEVCYFSQMGDPTVKHADPINIKN